MIRTLSNGLAITGTIANVLLCASTFALARDTSWDAIVAWGLLALLLLHPLDLARRLQRLEAEAPGALAPGVSARLVLGALAPSMLALALLFRELAK
jgi:hypothetical protein